MSGFSVFPGRYTVVVGLFGAFSIYSFRVKRNGESSKNKNLFYNSQEERKSAFLAAFIRIF